MEQQTSFVLQLGWAIYMSVIFIVVMTIASFSYMKNRGEISNSDSEN